MSLPLTVKKWFLIYPSDVRFAAERYSSLAAYSSSSAVQPCLRRLGYGHLRMALAAAAANERTSLRAVAGTPAVKAA